jgi:radical SAM protein with 4Fe4S-binding SPASM domain
MNQKFSQINSFIELYTEGATLEYLIHRPINKKHVTKYKRCYIENSLPMNFEPNGDLTWCLCLGHENGRIGNYKENIYFDKEKALRFGNRTIFKIEKCKNCELKYICAGGCPIPLTSSDKDLYQPVCGLYGLEEFWDRLEELV